MGSPSQLDTKTYRAHFLRHFENGALSVRFYYQPDDNKYRMLCRTLQPWRLRKDCCALLTDLEVDRSGPLLKFLDKHTRQHWAILRFLTYER